MNPPTRLETLLSCLVYADDAGICDNVQGGEACLSQLTEVFERAFEWVSNDPARAGLLLRACIASESELPERCTDPSIPEPVRIAFVKSMETLLTCICRSEHVLRAAKDPVLMWWDIFAIGWRTGPGQPSTVYYELSSGTRVIADLQLTILSRLLRSDSSVCCESALHGLNHLAHPQSEATVARFIDERRDWLANHELLEYAMRCRDALEL
jgi:hypothetical protein